MEKTFLEIKDLNISFNVNNDKVHVLNEINFNIMFEDSIAIIGESGSGKSILVKTICGILPKNLDEATGKMFYMDKEISIEDGINKKNIGIVLQNPMQSFNPTIKIGAFMNDVFEANNIEDDLKNTKKIEIIESLGINNPKSILKKYPHELSGGMLQRLAIGITLAKKPKILICDEPTSSLDVVMQKKIIDLIKKEKEKQKFILLFITHDISTIKGLCEKVIVMKKGKIIERNSVENIFNNTENSYTEELIKSSF